MSSYSRIAAQFGVKAGLKRQNTLVTMLQRMMMMMMLTAASVVIFIIIAARQKHLDPRVNTVNWQRGQQLLNDLNNTCTHGRLF